MNMRSSAWATDKEFRVNPWRKALRYFALSRPSGPAKLRAFLKARRRVRKFTFVLGFGSLVSQPDTLTNRGDPVSPGIRRFS